jgi:hypothetical protein
MYRVVVGRSRSWMVQVRLQAGRRQASDQVRIGSGSSTLTCLMRRCRRPA